MEEENNPEQEKTVEQEVAEEVAKNGETEPLSDGKEYQDLTDSEAEEEEKFQEVVNAADALDAPEKVEQAKEEIVSESEKPKEDINTEPEVPDIEPAKPEETIEDKSSEAPPETANVIKDQDMIFVQYECENPECQLKFYINNVDNALGDKLKCYGCGKKTAKKRRLMDVTLKQYKDYEEN